MLIVVETQSFIPGVMMTPPKDVYAKNRWLAAEMSRIGYGAQSELARRLDLPPSAINNILKSKRKISAAEIDIIETFIDEKLRERRAPHMPRKTAMRRSTVDKVPVVGYVTAGAQEHRLPLPAGDLDLVDAPEHVTDKTVAVQIRGRSMGELFDRWYAFYDDVRTPFTEDLIGALCVVGVADGRVMIKKVTRSRKAGAFTLLSENEPPIRDVRIEWAAKVKSIAPR